MDESAILARKAADLEGGVVERMIRVVESAADLDGWDNLPSLVALVDPLTLSLLSLGGEKEVEDDALVGAVHLTSFQGQPHAFLMRYDVPEWVLGLVLMVEAWSYPEDISADVRAMTLPWDHAEPGEMRFCITVLRDGRTFWMERSRGQEAAFRRDHDPSERMVSALQRSLGLPTPPPEDPVEILTGRLWLSEATDLAQEALQAGHPLTWDGTGLAGGEHALELDGQDERSRNVTHLGWEGMRQCAIEGEVEGIEPEDAQWMDVGTFSRLVLGLTHSAGELLLLLQTLTDPDTAQAVEERLHQLGWVEEA